nr:EOG090X02EM [Lepidurus arcticus]
MGEVNKRQALKNLEKWENLDVPLADLDANQQNSVLELSLVCRERPVPAGLPLGVGSSLFESVCVEETSGETTDVITRLVEDLKSRKQKIESTQQFLQWYSELESEVLQQEDAPYVQYAQQLQQNQNECKGLLEQVAETLSHLGKLKEQYGLVSHKTNSLHEACEQMLADQTKLAALADDIENRLMYFMEVDRLGPLIDSPTLSVHSDHFLELLSRLDECITYMDSHLQYKEATLHATKLRVLRNKCLSLIKSWVVQALESSTLQAKSGQADALLLTSQLPGGNKAPVPESHAYTLLYGKFRAHAAKMRILMEAVESRLSEGPEYDQVWSDCLGVYFVQRNALLKPSLAASLKDLSAAYLRDNCALVRASCAFLLHVCQDEAQLYNQFFDQASSKFEEFLDGLCSVMYDNLRPSIIHMNHMETLAELCTILRVEMLDEHAPSAADLQKGNLQAFQRLMATLLADAQERLVYRAHVYIGSDILGYKAAPGDLAYPEKLQMMETIAETLQQQSPEGRSDSRASMVSITSQDVRSHTGNSPADLHGMWYPPLRRALLCLSKLYRCVDRATFQGLSQEVLAAACTAISQAAQTISHNKTPLDGQLFHIKHLLILREQIAPFQVDFTVKEMSLDFSSVKTAAMGLIQHRNRLFSLSASNALLEFLLEGTPQVRQHLTDSRRLADRQLKVTCEAFIQHCGEFLTAPLRVLLDKVDSWLKAHANDGQALLKSEAFAKAETVGQVVSETQHLIRSKLPVVQKSMQLYLANRETEFILFRPVKNLVVNVFIQLHELVFTHHNEEEQLVINCPTQEQISVMLSALLMRRPDM